MTTDNNRVSLRIWGDFACFTRPELKVERVSYPLPTPSAARGMMEAVFWEPQCCYKIDNIKVVRRGHCVNVRRNELVSVINLRRPKPILAGAGAGRDATPRGMLCLSDVEYIVTAEVCLTDRASERTPRKYVEEFRRRASRGKCHHRPVLGMREFAADFNFEPDPQAALERRAAELGLDWRAIWPSECFGVMLYDIVPFKKRLEFQGRNPRLDICYFDASIMDATMDCHPDRVQMFMKGSSSC